MMNMAISGLDPRLARQYQELMLGVGEDPDLMKALEAGTGTDAASFTGGRALTFESLEAELATSVWNRDEYRLWNLLQQLNRVSDIGATVDQWNRRSAYGGYRLGGRLFGTATSEGENPLSHAATISREIGYVGYFRTRGDVTHPMTLMRATVDGEKEEEEAAIERTMEAFERSCLYGDRDLVATEVNGLLATIRDTSGSGNIINVNGAVDEDDMRNLCEIIRSNYGRPAYLLHGTLCQNDFDAFGQPKERIQHVIPVSGMPAPGAQMAGWTGTPVRGFASAYGFVNYLDHVFMGPGEVAPASASVGESGKTPPATPTLNSLTAAGTDGSFTAAQAGTYYYQVAAINRWGYSAACAAQSVAVAATEHVTIDMTTADATTTAYLIFRSVQDAASGADCRLMHLAFPYSTGTNDTVNDLNVWWPGTEVAFGLPAPPHTPDIRRLFPCLRFDLAITTPSIPFLVMLYAYLRIRWPEKLAMMRNIVPTGHDFSPFT